MATTIDVDSTITVGTTLGASESIDMRAADGGRYIVPSGSGITELTWYESIDNSTFVASYDGDEAAVTQTVSAAKGYPIPPTLNACKYVKAVASGGTAGTIQITLKRMGEA